MPYLGSGRLVGLINYAQSNRGVRARVAKFASLRDRLPVPFLFTSGNVAMSEVGKQVSKTATEVHGGMGFTDELGLHYWFKRIGLNRQLLGSPDLLREEAAEAQGI